MKKRITILASGILFLFLTSCIKDIFCLTGNGIVEVEKRPLTSFVKIENTTSFDVVFNKTDTIGARITADQNVLKYIETDIHDGCLEIRVRPGTICIDYTRKPLINVSSPALRGAVISGSGELSADTMAGEAINLKVSGSGDLSVKSVTGNDCQINISGSGKIDIHELLCMNADMNVSGSGSITLSGSCENEHLRISGSGQIHSYEFPSQSATITISGSGNAYTNIETYLNGHISGSGNIYLIGDPEIVQNITGSGKVIKHH